MTKSWFTENGEEKKGSQDEMRLLSPSQINTFLGCPRKWYYRYILKIPEKDTFALSRGKAVHSVLEHFFDYKPAGKMSMDDLEHTLYRRSRMLLEESWKEERIFNNFPEEKIKDTQEIVDRFVTRTIWKVKEKQKKVGDLVKAWNYIKPSRREQHIHDKELGVQGFIDAVIEKNGNIILVDYKTSSVFRHPHSDDYFRQLMLYALMYERETGILPEAVSIDYLIYGEMFSIPVRRELVDEMYTVLKDVRAGMTSKKMDDYPQDEKQKFCRWCTYEPICWGGEQ